MNKFISKSGKLIQDNLKSILLYYDHFYPGVKLPRILDYRVSRKFVHFLLRIAIIIAYHLRVYKIWLPIVDADEEALIVINGTGRWLSKIKLIKQNDKFKITKTMSDTERYFKEKRYYELYKDKSKHILLPRNIFLEDNTSESEFIKHKTFHRLLADGTISFNKAMFHFNNIKSELKKLYKKGKTVIHGDLNSINIFIENNRYYFIDFSESQELNYQYDLYVLLYSLLTTMDIIQINEFSIRNYKYNDKTSHILLETTVEGLDRIEDTFRKLRGKKYDKEIL